MGRFAWTRNHPFLLGALALLLLAGLWIGYSLATFDLNDYRSQLQDRLETRLAMPVRLGDAKLRLRDAGIAITFNDVIIGSDTSKASLVAPDVWLLFEWSALFRQELRFSKIGLLHPVVRITLSEPSSETLTSQALPPLLAGGHSILEGLSIQTLEIRDGQAQFIPQAQPDRTSQFSFEAVNLHISHLGLGQTATFTLTAAMSQNNQPASINLTGMAELPDSITAWADTRLDLNTDVSHLEGASISQLPVLPPFGFTLTGQMAFESRVTGTLTEGLTLSTKLTSDDMTLSSSRLPAPYPLRHFRADATLNRKGSRFQLQDMSLNLDGMRLTGNASLQQAEDNNQLDLQLTQGDLPLESLLHFLPNQQEFPFRPTSSGSIWLEQGQVKVAFGGTTAATTLETLRLGGTLQDLSWQLNPATTATLTRLHFSSDGPLLKLVDGKGTIGSTPLGFNGLVDLSDFKAPNLDLILKGTTQSGELLALLGKSLKPAPQISGALPFAAKLSGTPKHLNLDLDVNLEAVAVIAPERFSLPPTPGSGLQLHGLLSGQRFDIEHAHLQLQPFSGRIAGRLDWSKQPTIAIQGLLEVTDAAKLQPRAPLLKKLRLEGAANLKFSLDGPLRQPETLAVLTLHDLSFSMHGIIADISKLQGKVHLTRTGLESEELLARIGTSPVTFSARLADWANPNLVLDIRADQVRADDLIFYSDQTYLHDLESRVEITPDKVAFTPARVRLPNGTQAKVTGQVTHQPQVKVELDITSEFAHIEEVIGLWGKVSPEAREARRVRQETRTAGHKPYQVIIRARADKGELYGMNFQDAVGTIEQIPGQLRIRPLDFRVDGGDCTAQVLVDFDKDQPPLLRISGHAQDVDAYRIYNELLKQKSILRGSLSGDFYLQGQIGEGYLPSSFGSFDVEIKDGVLRKFHVLSKIFSLLNVSQLFVLKLPDMDLEGMPFDTITGSLVMKNGVLSSEKLLVKSEAMNQSYIGQFDLVNKQVDFTLAIQPLRTVDKILSKIPIAGWLLTGEEKALITTHFSVKGPFDKPEISAQPVTSLSEKTLGLIRRTLGLPVKLVTDPSILWGSGSEKK